MSGNVRDFFNIQTFEEKSMKQGTLKVGISEPKFNVKCPIQVAENVEDMMQLAKGSVAYIVDAFMRGHRINLQESDARAKVAELATGRTTAELADEKFLARVSTEVGKLLESFDPTAERKRGGRPQKPVNVAVDPNRKYTVAEMQALLAAGGAKVNFVPQSK